MQLKSKLKAKKIRLSIHVKQKAKSLIDNNKQEYLVERKEPDGNP